MSAENGTLTMAFTRQNPEIGEYISQQLLSLRAANAYSPDTVGKWSFLEGWNNKCYELRSQLIIFDSIHCIEQFCEELIQKFPDVGFCGTIYHDWVNSEPSPTLITFMHKKNTKNLFWYLRWWSDEAILEADDDFSWSGDIDALPPTKITHWSWNITTGKKKKLSDSPWKNYYAEYLKECRDF